MGLQLNRIKFVNFRNYRELDLDGLGRLTLFVGPNAVGKTNIVEGIQLITAQTSFRKPTVGQMISQGSTFSRLDGWVADTSRDLQITLQLEDGKKKRFLNGKAKRAADIRGIIPSVMFTPDDLELARSASAPRREALDALGAQLSANHHRIKSDYEKVVRGKNRLLREEASPALIESMDEVLIVTGAQLTCYRATLFMRLAEAMGEYYEQISGGGETFQACYVPSWAEHDPASTYSEIPSRDDARLRLERALRKRRQEEMARRRAVVGPHADHLEFFIDGRNVAQFGSQGQRRSLVLAFKLAETALIETMLDQKPILLLDDVMGELDASRRAALTSLACSELQTFITVTEMSNIAGDLIRTADVIELPLQKK